MPNAPSYTETDPAAILASALASLGYAVPVAVVAEAATRADVRLSLGGRPLANGHLSRHSELARGNG